MFKNYKLSSIIIFVLALIFYFFSNGKYFIPIAAWLAPIIIIRYMRSQTKTRGVILIYLSIVLLSFIQWKGWIPAPGIWFYFADAGNITLLFIPYIFDRYINKRVGGFLGTFAYPLMLVFIEYSTQFLNVHASWGSVLYTQKSNLIFLQLISITGFTGIAFIIGWTAGILNWVYENKASLLKVKKGVLIYSGVFIFIILFGSIRLNLLPNNTNTVQISSISIHQDAFYSEAEQEALRDVTSNKNASKENIEASKKICNVINKQLFEKTREQARNGSKIIFWSELNGNVFKEDEQAFLDEALKVAKEEKIYLMVCYAALKDIGSPMVENKAVAFEPSGKKVLDYTKTNIAPGDKNIKGDGNLQVFNTPYGTIGTAICYDTDFPSYIHKIAKQKPDIFLIPKNDWKDIVPIHSYMGSMRGIENGFATVEQSNHGLSIAFDYKGNVISRLFDNDLKGRFLELNKADNTENSLVLISNVPTKGTTTIYSIIGDIFSWICIAGLIALFAKSLFSESINEKRYLNFQRPLKR